MRLYHFTYLIGLFLLFACSESIEINDELNKEEFGEKEIEMTDENESFDYEIFNERFPVLNCQRSQILDQRAFYKTPLKTLSEIEFMTLYDNDEIKEMGHRAFGKFELTQNFVAYVILKSGYEGSTSDLWIYNKKRSSFYNKPLSIAGTFGCAGEELIENAWISKDLVGIPPYIVTRSGSTYLDIDADESLRKSDIQDVNVLLFDTILGRYIETNDYNVDSLNSLYKLEF